MDNKGAHLQRHIASCAQARLQKALLSHLPLKHPWGRFQGEAMAKGWERSTACINAIKCGHPVDLLSVIQPSLHIHQTVMQSPFVAPALCCHSRASILGCTTRHETAGCNCFTLVACSRLSADLLQIMPRRCWAYHNLLKALSGKFQLHCS